MFPRLSLHARDASAEFRRDPEKVFNPRCYLFLVVHESWLVAGRAPVSNEVDGVPGPDRLRAPGKPAPASMSTPAH